MAAPSPLAMRRLTLIALAYLTGLTALGALVMRQWGAGAEDAGRALYPHRRQLARLEEAAADPPPVVAWLGDSTIYGGSYPDLIARSRLGPSRPSLKVAFMGLDFWAYYQLLGPVMDRQPPVVVLVANMRVMRLPSGTRGYGDLAHLLPLGELPRTLALPFSFRGMTAPRLLLARALSTPWGEEAFHVAEGLRREFQAAPFWEIFGPEEPPRSDAARRFWALSGQAAMLTAYDAPLGPDTPLVRFCRAAVRFARARGAQVLVVVSPMPTRILEHAGHYDAARAAERIAMLRREVESAGGRLLDLHDALPSEFFRDDSGHFTPAGQERMAALVWPQVAISLLAAQATPPASRLRTESR